MSNLTIITATLGRPSLALTAKNIQEQVYPVKWLVIFDGLAARDKGLRYIPENDPNITVLCSETPVGEHYPLMFKYLDQITTKYVGFVDDDNEIVPKHTRALYDALLDSHRIVATNRLYCDANMRIVAREHPDSSQVDTNNMALEVSLLKDVAAFYEREAKGSLFTDRHLISYLLSRNIKCARVKGAYTVVYRINPMLDIRARTGLVLLEDLTGSTLGFKVLDPNIELSREILLK